MEILIGLALTSLLLAFLFSSMTRSFQFETKIEGARKTLLEREHLHTRLQDLFLSLNTSSLHTKKLPGDKKESLIAIFDQGIDPDPSFSGAVLSRIYLDEENQLCLALWPIGQEKAPLPWRREILLSGVEDFQFYLLGEKRDGAARIVNANLAWFEGWPEIRSDAPSMIRLMIRHQGADLNYAFSPANPEPLVTYWEEGYRS